MDDFVYRGTEVKLGLKVAKNHQRWANSPIYLQFINVTKLSILSIKLRKF